VAQYFFRTADATRGFRSARLLRESEDKLNEGDAWSGTSVAVAAAKPAARPRGSSGAMWLCFAAILFVLAAAPQPWRPRPALGDSASMTPTLRKLLLRLKPVEFRQDFERSFDDWISVQSGAAWVRQPNGLVKPGSLRIWRQTMSFADYEFDFTGRIQGKSLDWAYRAADSRDYYVAKLEIVAPNAASAVPNAALVRYAVCDGRVLDRSELPIPLHVNRSTDYHVRFSARGDRFRAFVNGQIVGSWTDARISRGGVGFLSEAGETPLLARAKLSERDSLLSRLAAQISTEALAEN
jgi:hypothetical protein